MESIWDRYYSATKRFSLLAGQWPYQNKNERVFRMGIITIATLSLNVPQIYKFIQCNKDFECICRIIPAYTLALMIMTKLYMGLFRMNKIKILIDRVFVNWRRLQNAKEHEIMKTYVASARWLVLMYSTVCVSGVALFVFVTLIPHILDVVLPLNESRPIVLPFEGYFFVDERKHFFYIFFYSLITSEIAMITFIAQDTILITFVEHVCGIFTVAGFRFERLAYEDIDVVEIVNNDIEGMYNKRMACCMNVHCAALKFIDYLENIFSINLGIILMLVTIVLSIILFQISVQSDIVEILRLAAYVGALLIHVFVFCWEGQRMIDHSLQIHDKIYNCTWYKIPVKSQRLIMNVMKRTLQLKSISAGKIFIFSLQGFTTIMQTSMSYFTVLSSVQ